MKFPWENDPLVEAAADVLGAGQQEDVPEPPEEGSALDEITRKLGVASRAVVSGAPLAIGGLPALASDAYDSLINLTRRVGNVFLDDEDELELIPPFQATRLGMQAGEELASMTGLPEPETRAEKLMTTGIQAGTQAATGSGLSNILSRQLARSAPKAVSPFPTAADRLGRAAEVSTQAAAARPVSSTIAATSGGVGAEYAAQQGLNPLGVTTSALLASVAPSVAAKTAARAITPVDAALNAEQIRLRDLGKTKYGFDMTAGQETGSRALQKFEQQLEALPGGGASPRVSQQEQFNRAISKAFDQDEPLITQDLLNKAQSELGSRMNKIVGNKSVTISDAFPVRLGEITNKYFGRLPTDIARPFQNIRNDLLDLMDPKNPVSGERIQRIRTDLLERARNTSDSDYRQALNEMRDALDNELEAVLPKVQADDLRAARTAYANLSRVKEAMKTQTPDVISGNVDPSALLRAVSRQDADAATRGLSFRQLAEPASIKRSLMPRLPESGTPIGTYFTGLATGGGLAGGGYAAAGPTGAMLGALSSLATPSLINRAYWSPILQQYFKNQLMAGRRPTAPGGLSPVVTGQQTGGLLSR